MTNDRRRARSRWGAIRLSGLFSSASKAMGKLDEVFWIKSNPPVELAIVLRPRGGEWLANEMLRIKRSGVRSLVSLLEPEEAKLLGLEKEGVFAEEAGLRFLNYPIPDTRVPADVEHFRAFVSGVAERLRAGESVGMHCRACIGRSTIMAACTLIHIGLKPLDAVAAVEAARRCRVPENSDQLEWILHYRAKP
jgi:protein-tyrosine phosphatase